MRPTEQMGGEMEFDGENKCASFLNFGSVAFLDLVCTLCMCDSLEDDFFPFKGSVNHGSVNG